ncbi:MAG: ATP-binding protein [Rhodospirillales bacterium]|nr:ATP-binding protein [Rhodospirillales bacterium]
MGTTEIKKNEDNVKGHGCEVFGLTPMSIGLSADNVREILSTRFLTDPNFKVSVNGVWVTFEDVPSNCISEMPIEVPNHGTAKLLVIDSQETDRTTKQHGIAWRVQNRLVGECDWRWMDNEKVLDGRSVEAKRYTFIIFADFLTPAVNADWTGFKTDLALWQETDAVLQEAIFTIIKGITEKKRAKTKEIVRKDHRKKLKAMPILSRERWNQFLDNIVDDCPNLSDTEIEQVMKLLTNMEVAKSQYSLLDKLHKLSPDDIDDWDAVLESWSVQSAKIVLDEIETRLKLIEEIRIKTERTETDEVQELQPLFKQGLWIFGPQFESIEFTSNRGMTNVIKNLFKVDDTGSRNRPDFVIIPDSSVGFYSRPSFDKEFNESGTRILVIVELKRPGITIGTEEKSQVWKYVRELIKKGYITNSTEVFGYVLGNSIDPTETTETTQLDGRVRIRPMLYDTFVGQAEKRMLNLQQHVKEAPFMQEVLKNLYVEDNNDQEDLLNMQTAE